MYVPAWPVLNPARLLGSPTARLPFPLSEPDSLGFHVARSAIYQLFRAFRFDREKTVLVPAYHHGNEVRAIRAAGARVRFYSIDRRLQPDLGELRRLSRDGARALFVIHYLGWPQPIAESGRRRSGTRCCRWGCRSRWYPRRKAEWVWRRSPLVR